MALLRWLRWRFRARTLLAVTILILGVVFLPKLLGGVPKLVLILAGIIGLLLIGAIVAPKFLLSRDLVAGLKPADRLNAENQLRGTMMQGVTGLLVLAGAFVAWQQVQVGQRQLESTIADQRTTQQISREGQITDRYTRAIQQLGSESLELRLGAIYALERIAKDSQADQDTITEILTTFVRVHAPWPSPQPDDTAMPQLERRATDVQAVLDVLGRRAYPRGDFLHLADTDLRNANLGSSDFRGAFLWGAHLEGSYLGETDLQGANLKYADLTGASLEQADLRGAQLEGAVLKGAELSEAIADSATVWPAGFDVEAANVRVHD
jgi:Pentapeptide repeats (8 copies)